MVTSNIKGNGNNDLNITYQYIYKPRIQYK